MNKLPKNFDYNFYSNYYKDLNNAFGYNKDLLEQHYMSCGRYENRRYCQVPDDFNWINYILSNKHYFNRIELCNKENAIDHYLNSNEKPLFILYYAYLNQNKDWKRMVHDQLTDVARTLIFDKSEFQAVLLGTPTDIAEAKIIIDNILNRNVVITEVYENKYEFPAIIKIRELALQNPNKIFIYFHSKGMVNHNFSIYRTHIEWSLTNKTFLNWESTLNIFNMFPNINKAALFPSESGFGWFNFWWARASYLISCKPIEIPENLVEPDRFICEGWLGQYGNNSSEDCYSILHQNISISLEPSNDIYKIM
jgi:hypothetical protein